MRKIIIIGPAGAGKSTLAETIAERLNLPHTELDGIYHQQNWAPIDKNEFRMIVRRKAQEDGWVICGNYFSTLGLDFWGKADTIIWCDYSFPLVMSRLLRRTLRRTISKEELWNGNTELFFVNFFTRDSLILFMMKSWNKQKKRYGPIFTSGSNELPGVRLVRLKTPGATEAFLKHVR